MFKILKKLFEPFFLAKSACTKLILESFAGAVWYDFVPILAIPYLTILVESKNKEQAFYFIIYLSIFYILIWVLGYFIRVWDYEARAKMEIALNNKYRPNILLKEGQSLDRMGTGKLQSIVQKGFSSWVDTVWYILYQMIRVIVGLAVGVYLTYQMGSSFLILFLLLSVASAFGFIYFKRREIKYKKVINDLDDDLNKNYIRLLMSRQEVLFAGAIPRELNLLKESITAIIKKYGKVAKLDFVSDLFVSSTAIILPIAGAILVLFTTQEIETGVFLSLIYFSSRFTGTMYWFVWLSNQFIEKYPGMKKFWDFIEFVPTIKNYETGKKFDHKIGEIELQNIFYNYSEKKNVFFDKYSNQDKQEDKNFDANLDDKNNQEEDEPDSKVNIFENFNLKINGGKKVALIGKSGSGKTTLVKLITGYLTPIKGKVIIDGQDLQSVSLKTYYDYLGYLTQEPNIFDGSIKENLLYAAKKKISDEEINIALQEANCDFVFKLKKKLNTQIGERGVRLSGGEKQRLAIAKLFIKNPDIIILDEPTSALDSFSEELVTQALNELFVNKTVIIIAHRLQTVRNADEIIVLEAGKIVERGNHNELTSFESVYKQMLNLQSGLH